VPRRKFRAGNERAISRVSIRAGQKPVRGAEEKATVPRVAPSSDRACRLVNELHDGSLKMQARSVDPAAASLRKKRHRGRRVKGRIGKQASTEPG